MFVTDSTNLGIKTVPSAEWYQGPLATFWLTVLGIIVSTIGLYFSIKAFKAASKAVIAASKAGHVVKVQDMLMEVSALIQKYRSDPKDKYEDVSKLITEVSSTTERVVTHFSEKVNGINPTLIADLNSALANARGTLITQNPAVNPALNAGEPAPQSIYFKMEPDLSIVEQKLNALISVLEKIAAPGGDNE